MYKRIFIKFLFLTVLLSGIFPASGQVLESVDKRSLKNKIDDKQTEPPVVSIADNGQLSIGRTDVSLTELRRQIDELMDQRSPDLRLIELQGAGGDVEFRHFLPVLKLGRELELDDFAITAGIAEGEDLIRLKIVLDEPVGREPKPGGMFLRVELADRSTFSLNGVPKTDTSLKANLKAIFADRTRRKIRVVGGDDIEKSVFIKPRLSTKVSDLVEMVRLLRETGASPIGIQIDWMKP